ncbi:MAG TPA: lysoplasmalogenase [Polyangia bacterium]|nr:lysoplasmalogenase [Polyangia bacterium]
MSDVALAAAVGALVCALLLAEWRASAAGKWVAKPLASAGFVALAVERGACASRYGQAIFAALVLSWIGDVFLIPKNKAWFRAGLFAFLLGHLGFCAAFWVRGVSWPIAGGSAAVLAMVAFLVGRWLLPHVEPKMRPPVIAYVVVITSMVALAIGSIGRQNIGQNSLQRSLHETLPDFLPLIAALMFYVSDLSVARDTFVKRSFRNRAWGLPLYYGAQVLFAWSIV